MTFDESIQGMRLQVIRRASQIGVSAACAEAGISRTLFYRWQQRLSRYGVDGLHPRRLRARPGRPPQLPAQVERRLLAVGGRSGWRRTRSGCGGCGWPPARYSDCCAGTGWLPGGNACSCSSTTVRATPGC